MEENLGRRIAARRGALGLTQQELADRVAISRVAVSHLEASMSLPSERTIVLLAGVFKLEPLELVEGTAYPMAKAERLPAVAARHTEAELQVALLQRDLAWLDRIADLDLDVDGRLARGVADEWVPRLRAMAAAAADGSSAAEVVEAARRRLPG